MKQVSDTHNDQNIYLTEKLLNNEQNANLNNWISISINEEIDYVFSLTISVIIFIIQIIM